MRRYLRFGKPSTDGFLMDTYIKYKSNSEATIINEGTDDEFIFVPEEVADAFYITALSREDFESMGWDASSLTDGDMEHIASKMGDNYVGNGEFWDEIDFWAEEYNLPKNNPIIE